MSPTVKLGLFMVLAMVLAAWMILSIEEIPWFGPKGVRYRARFQSIAGLDDKAPVRLAGVRVGRVDGIRLVGREAEVELLLEWPISLPQGTVVAVVNQGLLGDKYVEIELGPEGAPSLPPGSVLPGRPPFSFDGALAKLEKLGGAVEEAFSGFSAGGGVGDLVRSLRETAEELRAVIAENRGALSGTVRNFERLSASLADDLPRLAARLEQLAEELRETVSENRGNLRDSLANVRELTENVKGSVANVNQISDRLARGEGTLGKLLTSDEAHTSLVGALDSLERGVNQLSQTLSRVDRLRLDLGFEAGYLDSLNGSRSAFRLDVLPRGDESPRLYRLELVSDPRGRLLERRETVTVTAPDGSSSTSVTERRVRDTRRYNYSALLGVPFAERRGALWAGVIENTGGVQLEYRTARWPVRFSLEAFDFSREEDLDPHLRLALEWNFFRNLYLKLGYDDLLVSDDRGGFFGAGLRWSDEDLKYLLGSVPRP
jgi:phospholipid/cholesterol/gamma-HCH transport system substrate-binding protein